MEQLLNLLSRSKTQFHTVNECKQILKSNDFKELNLNDDWGILEKGKYFVSPFSSMLVGFVVNDDILDIRIASCHTDFPMLKLKTNPDISKKGYWQVNVEPYGGLISKSWFDRPLALAGKIVLKSDDPFSPKPILFDSSKPLFIIPSLAPHLSRDTKNQEMDLQKELLPIVSCSKDFEKENNFIDYIAKSADINPKDILDYDLYLYVCDEPTFVGAYDEMLSAPRIDNISSVSAILEGLLSNDIDNCIAIGAFFDNEEIGSRSKQGADSVLLKEIITRIAPHNLYKYNIFNISMDVAHATHPNYIEKNDITNDVVLGQGVVLKSSASQRYVTDSEAGAVIISLCSDHNIKLQRQVNRSGMPGGQTLGPIMSSYIPAKSVDLGLPMLAMHSARELISAEDYNELVKLTTAYYCH